MWDAFYLGSPECWWVRKLGSEALSEQGHPAVGEAGRTQWALLHPLAKSLLTPGICKRIAQLEEGVTRLEEAWVWRELLWGGGGMCKLLRAPRFCRDSGNVFSLTWSWKGFTKVGWCPASPVTCAWQRYLSLESLTATNDKEVHSKKHRNAENLVFSSLNFYVRKGSYFLGFGGFFLSFSFCP